MIFGEPFRQAAPAGWWTYSLSSYIVMPWGIWQQNHSKKRWRTACKLGRSVHWGNQGTSFSLLYTFWASFFSIFIRHQLSQMKYIGGSWLLYLCCTAKGEISKLLDNCFKVGRWNKILLFWALEKRHLCLVLNTVRDNTPRFIGFFQVPLHTDLPGLESCRSKQISSEILCPLFQLNALILWDLMGCCF